MNVRKLKQKELEENIDKHGVEDLSIITYKDTFAWELQDPDPFDPPVRHIPKQAARIWMNIEYPLAEARARARLDSVRALEPSDSDSDPKLMKILDDCCQISLMSRSKNPYFRVLEKRFDLSQKFPFKAGDPESQRASAAQALEFNVELAKLKDESSCMQLPELKKYMTDHGLPKSGNLDKLREAMVAHKVKDICKRFQSDVAAKAFCDRIEKEGAQVAKEKGVEKKKEVAGTKDQEPKDSRIPGTEKDEKLKKQIEGSVRCKFFDAQMHVLRHGPIARIQHL